MQKPSDWATPSSSAELRERMQAISGGTTLLAFSRGKDALAAWLAMRGQFKRIIPVHYVGIPGLRFIEDSLKYFEDFFGCKIHRRLHPSFIRKLYHGTFLPWHRAVLATDFGIPVPYSYTHELILDDIRDELGLDPDTPVATGIRQADSVMRGTAMRRFGPVNWNRKAWYPVYDWSLSDVVESLQNANVKLPVDYALWGSTFDGIDYRYLRRMREELPEDYATVLKWFPLAEVEMLRRNLR